MHGIGLYLLFLVIYSCFLILLGKEENPSNLKGYILYHPSMSTCSHLIEAA